MEALTMPMIEESTEATRLADAPPPKFEEEELELLAFELWQRACCPETTLDQGTSAAKEAWSHASSL